MNADLNGQCTKHFPVNLNWDVGIAFYSHPIGDLNIHIRVKTDKSTSEGRKLPQSNYRATSPEPQQHGIWIA